MLESFFDRITRASLRFKWVTILLSAAALVAGVFAVTQLKQELIPSIEFPQTIIFALNQGMDSEDMLEQVTIPLEEAIGQIEGVVNIETTTSSGVSVLIARNEFGIDLEAVREEINDVLNSLSFPEGMETPEMLTFSFSDLPIAALSVSSTDLSLMELKELVEENILPAIEGLEDVASVQIGGGQELPPSSQVAVAAPQPTAEPPLMPTEAPVEGVALPDSWIQAAAAQNVTIAFAADLTPEMVEAAIAFAPRYAEDLTPEILFAMPLDALAVIPDDYLQTLDADVQAQIAERLANKPVPLPDSWIEAGAAQNNTLETPADLTQAMVATIATFAPQLLDDLTPEMLLAMPLEALAGLPAEYFETLDGELQAELGQRLAAMPAAEDTGELPPGWQSAGQVQGIPLQFPEDVTPEILQGIASFVPQFLDDLSADNLRRFSPEVLGWLPANFIETLDADLRAELQQLAEPAGGLGTLAAQAEEEAGELASGAPALSGSWTQPQEGAEAGLPQPTFETAADLMTSGFASSAGGLLNLLVQRGQPQDAQLMADLTPDVLAWLTDNEEGFLENLSPATLRLFSGEVLSSLPADFLASLDAGLRTELEGIASGTLTAFIPEETINRLDGIPSLSMVVFKDNDANTVSVSHTLFARLDELVAENPGLRFETAFEQASFIEESISGVAREGGLGAIFAVIVILVFLSGTIGGRYKLSWRSTIVTAVSIPLSVFMAFALFRWLPPLANLILDPLSSSTAGVPLIGTIVALVSRLFPADLTLNIMTLSGMTVAIGRVIDDSIVVLENIYRNIQRGEDMEQSVLLGTRDVAIAIFASTVTTIVVFLPIGLLGGLIGEFFLPFGVSVTYALASSFLVAITIIPVLAFLFIRKDQLPDERETAIQRSYTPVLKWALRNRALTLAIAGVFLIGSLFLLSQRPRAFLPDFGEPQITVAVDLSNENTMADTDALALEFEKKLGAVQGLGTIVTEVGSGGGLEAAFFGGGIDQTAASIQINLKDVDDVDRITAEIRELAIATFGEDSVIVSSGTLSSGAFGGFGLVLSGDPSTLEAINDEAIAALEGIEGLTNISSNLSDSDVFLRVDSVPAVRFTGALETQDALGVSAIAKEALEALVPAGIRVSEGFETQQQTDGFMRAIRGVMSSILIVYLVMVVTFRSFVHPFTILFSLPMAIIGASIALWLTNRVLGLPVLIGMMMLVGIVVTNAILLIDRVQANRKKRGMNAYDALIEGGRTRLRPILMTAIAAILALVPLALGLTEGAIIATELATVVIGGLLTSTMLTLLIVPVMYSLLDRLQTRGKQPVVAESEEV